MITRRSTLAMGAGGVAAAMLPAGMAMASKMDEAMAAFTGGAAVGTGGITLTTPEIAENGNTVPVGVSAPGAVAVMLLADKNPSPLLCTITFGEGAGNQSAATRVRLGGTQNVIAVAKMADGSFVSASNEVKVTIGGCGG
jgi:sulfur-oxidizing protein SoxY